MLMFKAWDTICRNQWFNYSNFKFEGKPDSPPKLTNFDGSDINSANPFVCSTPAPGNCNPFSLYTSGPMTIANNRNIMLDMAILCGQDYREKEKKCITLN